MRLMRRSRHGAALFFALACACAAPEPEVSVHPGINEPYLAGEGELVLDDWLARFETESREIYAHKDAIVAALELEANDDVADVGAGTGLFTIPFARAVDGGLFREGTVYAVDIAPDFLEHVRTRARQEDVDNVETVLCDERSVNLPAYSVDVVFVCDTYHHFEYPRSTLASIRDALRPRGRLIVIDFERIPGTSSDWILEHVRADRQTVVAELQAAGFALVRTLDLPLEENYALEFRKD